MGVDAHLPDGSVLDACGALGVERIRIDVNWRDVHTGPSTFGWSLVDRAADRAAARGLSVFATLADTPDWVPRVSRACTDAYGGNDQPATSTEWVAFVTEAARHLRAHGVTHLGLWNEANLDGFWEKCTSSRSPGNRPPTRAPSCGSEEDDLDAVGRGLDDAELLALVRIGVLGAAFWSTRLDEATWMTEIFGVPVSSEISTTRTRREVGRQSRAARPSSSSGPFG